jgi:hypothetical protein
VARKHHLAALSEEALTSYESWVREGLASSYVDYPQWLIANMRSELAAILTEKSLREYEPQER